MKRLQQADRILGRAACRMLRPLARRPSATTPREVSRVLCIKFWGIGSLQLLTPAVHALRERHPGASIELLTLVSNRAFADGLGMFDRVRTLDVATGWAGIAARLARLVTDLRRGGHDVVYDFEFFTHVSALVAALSGAPHRVGFASRKSLRGGIHTETVPFRRSWHVARNFRALAGGENGRSVEPGDLVPFRVLPTHRAEAAALLLELGLPPTPSAAGRPLVCVNPHAGHLSLERRWPPERFAELIRHLIREHDAHVALIGAPSERGRALEVRVRAGALPAGRLLDLTGRLSIGGLCALFEEASALVTNDSGPMHLAAALGTPTLGLFGPETPQMYRPLGERATTLWNPPACSPCLNVHDNKLGGCYRGRPECMLNLGVGAVAAAVGELLPRRSPRTTAPT